MNDLQLRALTAEDLPAYWKLACAAFHSKNPGLEDEGAFLENCVKKEKAEKENPTALGNRLTRTGLFCEGKLLSTLTANAFEIHFDGTVCEMCGIGGVMSDPSARKTGGVTRILRQELAAMRDRGQVFSHLYPFQSSFYRKFGYAHCAFAERWTIPAQFLPEESFAVQLYENKPEEQQAVKALYQTFAAQYNLSVRRNDLRWASIFKKLQPYSGNNFSYLHIGENGPDGFLSYTTKSHDDAPMDIHVEDLFFTDPEALRQMLAFLGTQRAYAKQVRLKLPADADITFWLAEFCTAYDKCNVHRERIHFGATRVVDAEKALRLAKYQGKGAADLKILDPTCPWNDRCFHVEFDEHCLSVSETDRWDIEMDIGDFTALLLGGYTLAQAAFLPSVKIAGNREALQKIFYPTSLWLGDSF
jgi:predicted acetyltransferase